MSLPVRRVVGRFVIFALLGLLMEVFFTAGSRLLSGNWNMHGHSSPWMMVDYGLLGVALMPIARPLIRLGIPLLGRAFVYMAAIFFVEYVSGRIFSAFGLRIWDYSDLPLNLHGQITLLYAPFWYALGLAAELLHRRVDTISLVLNLGVTAEQVEAQFGPGSAALAAARDE